jgi:hypothetical protein
MKKKQAVFTIVTSDYFQQAVVLGKSIREFEKESDFFIFVVDYNERDEDYKNSGFSVLDAKVLYPGHNWDQFAFQYGGLALSCSLKPRGLLFLLNDYEKVICLDGDTKLFSCLEVAWHSLDHALLSLTPHNNKPVQDDGAFPAYVSIRIAGVFNTGFVAARTGAEEFLTWWWERLHYNCIFEPAIGIWNEQAYLNEAIPMVKDLCIIRNTTYNVSHWNLHERKIAFDGTHYTVNGAPLVFFHFSGPTFLHKMRISGDHDPVVMLYTDYEKELSLEKEKLTPKQYHYKFFHDGTLISEEWREWMRRGIPELEQTENPFHLTMEERAILEKTMTGRPENYNPHKNREINDWKHSVLGGTPTFKKLISDLHGIEYKMRGLEWKLARFENSLPHQLLSKAIDSVKALLRKTCFKCLVD